MSFGASKVRCASVIVLICGIMCGRSSGEEPSTPSASSSAPGKTTAKPSSEGTAPTADFSSILDRFPGKPEISRGMFNRSGSDPLPSGPVNIPNRRSRQADEDNWAFTTPDQAFRHFMANDILHLPQLAPNATDNNASSMMERSYDRVSSGGAANGPPALGILDLRSFIVGRQRTEVGAPSSATLPEDLGSSTPGVPHMNLDALVTRPDSSMDFFSRRRTVSAADMLMEREAQQKHLDAFRSAMSYGGQPTTLPGMTASTLPAPTRSEYGLAPIPGLAAPAKPNSYQNPAAVYSPDPALLSSRGIAPAAPAAPGYGRPAPPTPQVKPPKADFSLPQRPF